VRRAILIETESQQKKERNPANNATVDSASSSLPRSTRDAKSFGSLEESLVHQPQSCAGDDTLPSISSKTYYCTGVVVTIYNLL
jgi:hypothetical protein